ncbi:Elongator complex protein 4 [Daphnia magna]|uniref:Elongator complex protein 4 n=1 Tax=Daphnia magna TaxID=35525 RepID=A0A0P6BEI1_9CRUS|nr:Elongator complex protein 4 [Daphnia magna]
MAANIKISSFQKRIKPSNPNILGTKISAVNSTLNVSFGVTSLDQIIDGGLPLGSLCVVEEDIYGSYAKIITKYFLAEGAMQKNFLLSASLNENPWDLLNNLPSPVTEPRETNIIENREELKIAWRYENLTLEDNNQRLGNAFDLSIPYAMPETQKANLVVWGETVTPNLQRGTGTLKNSNCLSLLMAIEEAIKKWELDSGTSPNLIRIVVSSFGSPFWQFDENQSSLSTDFTATLLLLKSIVRSTNAVALVTIPHQLLNQSLVSRGRHLADVVIQLKSLREDPHLRDLMDIHGILELKKVANLTSLKPILGQDGTTTYGFKATKRKFKIEKLHLPPAIDDDKSSPDHSSSLGCSSAASKTNLDF